jgi:DNA-binding MarR family transcriptional regulator
MIIDKRMAMRMDHDAASAVDLDRWHDFYLYLAYGPTGCVVPYARTLGRLIDEHHLRIRRDADAIITAIESHTLLNQQRREKDRRDRWIAILEDYAAIQPIFDAILTHGREDVMSDGSRRLHLHVVARIKTEAIVKEQKPGSRARPQPLRKAAGLPTGTLTITVRQLAAELGISKSAVSRHVKELYDLQLIKNLETLPRQPLQLRVLAMPPDEKGLSVLPSPDVLAAAWEAERRSENSLTHYLRGTAGQWDRSGKG